MEGFSVVVSATVVVVASVVVVEVAVEVSVVVGSVVGGSVIGSVVVLTLLNGAKVSREDGGRTDDEAKRVVGKGIVGGGKVLEGGGSSVVCSVVGSIVHAPLLLINASLFSSNLLSCGIGIKFTGGSSLITSSTEFVSSVSLICDSTMSS